MKTFKDFIEIRYNPVDTKRLGEEEYNEIQHQSQEMNKHPENFEDIHPKIKDAIHNFAENKNSWMNSLEKSKVQKIKNGTYIHNSDIGTSTSELSSEKVQRVGNQLSSEIDRPIVLRHTDNNGVQHHYLVSGNTRATTVGFGVEAHHIEI